MDHVVHFMLSEEELYEPFYTNWKSESEQVSGRIGYKEAQNDDKSAIIGRYSVNLKIEIPFTVLSAAKSWIDPELFPLNTHTAEQLIQWISSTKWLDEINYYYPVPKFQDDGYVGLVRHNGSN